jgi:hypothetical protein
MPRKDAKEKKEKMPGIMYGYSRAVIGSMLG